jgi:DNA-binding NarL/FixJ family response regulator
MSKVFSILIADDHTLVRDMLTKRLDAEPDLQVVASVSNAAEAVGAAIHTIPDLILMDVDMPGLACFEAIQNIKVRCPDVRVLFLSAFTNDRYIDQALAVQASGYMTKEEPPEVIVHAIRTVLGGAVYFSPKIQSRLIIDAQGIRLARQVQTRSSILTPREIEVLRYLARGLSKKEIARTINLSVKTVDTHSANLMSKLDIHDRVELARFAIREGLAEA